MPTRKQEVPSSLFTLYLTNFITYMMIQMFTSVSLISGYAVVALAMTHNECRFNRADYDNDPEVKDIDDPNKQPNVTPTV